MEDIYIQIVRGDERRLNRLCNFGEQAFRKGSRRGVDVNNCMPIFIGENWNLKQ